MTTTPEALFFANAAALRRWFAKNAATANVLAVGFMKKGTGVPSITWPEAVDEALCVGWIDGVRHRIDEARYRIRFTPRRPGSHWSNINIRRVAVLRKTGRMKAAGLKAFAGRSRAKSGRASYEQKSVPKLLPRDIKLVRANAGAWRYFGSLPPGYLKMVTWWIVSAKKPETRAKRLAAFIQKCADGRRFTW